MWGEELGQKMELAKELQSARGKESVLVQKMVLVLGCVCNIDLIQGAQMILVHSFGMTSNHYLRKIYFLDILYMNHH